MTPSTVAEIAAYMRANAIKPTNGMYYFDERGPVDMNEEELPYVYMIEVEGKKLHVIETKYHIQTVKRLGRCLDLLNRAVLWGTPETIAEIKQEIEKP